MDMNSIPFAISDFPFFTSCSRWPSALQLSGGVRTRGSTKPPYVVPRYAPNKQKKWRLARLGETLSGLAGIETLTDRNPENIKKTVIAKMMNYSMEKSWRLGWCRCGIMSDMVSVNQLSTFKLNGVHHCTHLLSSLAFMCIRMQGKLTPEAILYAYAFHFEGIVVTSCWRNL